MFSKDKTQRLASDSDWAFWNDNPMKVNYYNISQPWRVGGDVCNSYLCLFTLQLLLNTAIQLINNCGVILFAYPFYVYFKSELFQDPPCYSSILLVFPRWKHRSSRECSSVSLSAELNGSDRRLASHIRFNGYVTSPARAPGPWPFHHVLSN